MSIRNYFPAAIILLFSLAACDTDRAEETAPDAEGIDVGAVILELQEVYAELRPMQDRVFESPDVLANQRRLRRIFTEAVLEERPDLEDELRQLTELGQEASRAMEAGDTTRAGELSAAAYQLQSEIAQMEVQMIRRPDIRAEMERFDRSVTDRMAAQDPEAERLLQRAAELEAKLAAAFPTPAPTDS